MYPNYLQQQNQPFMQNMSAPGAMSASPPTSTANMDEPDTTSQYQQNPGMPNAYAHGGEVRRSSPHTAGKMIPVHISKQELAVLDHLQGVKKIDKKTGMRAYPVLEDLVKHPHLRETIHHHYKDHLATGGNVDAHHAKNLQQLAQDGRYGDTEMALIGPHTHHLFDYMAGGKTQNPKDGFPEYWSLGGTLKSIWNTVKSPFAKIGQQALPQVAQYAGQKLGEGALGDIGRMALNKGAEFGANKLGQMGGPETAAGNTIGKTFNSMFDKYKSGAGLGKTLGAGLSTAGQDMRGSGLGDVMGAAGNALGQGQGIGGVARAGAQAGLNAAGGLSGLAKTGLEAFQNRNDPNALRQMGQQGLQNLLPNQQAMQREQYAQEMPFYNQDVA